MVFQKVYNVDFIIKSYLFLVQVFIGVVNGNERMIDKTSWLYIRHGRSHVTVAKNLATEMFTAAYLKDAAMNIDRCTDKRPGQEQRFQISDAELFLYLSKYLNVSWSCTSLRFMINKKICRNTGKGIRALLSRRFQGHKNQEPPTPKSIGSLLEKHL